MDGACFMESDAGRLCHAEAASLLSRYHYFVSSLGSCVSDVECLSTSLMHEHESTLRRLS